MRTKILSFFTLVALASILFIAGPFRASNKVPGPVASSSEVPKAGDLKTLTIKGVEYRFRYCPAGQFTMGSPEDEKWHNDDEVQHEVKLSRGFWMLETEVTQKMWKSVIRDNPSEFKGDDLPVDSVSWKDCQEFISKLNASSPTPGMKFRLPTEAEWEYACRAGSATPYYWGDALNGDKANCNGARPYGTSTEGPYLEKTTPVGSYSPNAWGLYDMSGNVYEWCNDWYGDYPAGTVEDPTGPSRSDYRISRGGCWFSSAEGCRSASRMAGVPNRRRFTRSFHRFIPSCFPMLRYNNIPLSYDGFRLAFSSPE